MSNTSTTQFTARKIAFAAVAIALAAVTGNFLKTPSLPFGGSVTLFSMLFICLIGYWYGPVVGIAAGVAHGIIQFICNPYVVAPFQVILDYPLAFGALGFSGFFSNKKLGLFKGYIAGVSGRFFFVCLSGIIYYTEYVGNPRGDIAAIWTGVAYNMSYIIPEMVITSILLLVPPVQKGLKNVKKLALGENS